MPGLTIRYQVEYKICIWKQMLFSQMYNSYQQANRSPHRGDKLKEHNCNGKNNDMVKLPEEGKRIPDEKCRVFQLHELYAERTY